MKIWRVHAWGEPSEQLRIDEIDAPTAGAGQVVIALESVGLNFPGLLQIRGQYQVKPPLPYSPGGESAGRIVGVGDGVTTHAVGDRVVTTSGGLAEQVAVNAATAFPLPDSLSTAKAAALPVNYGTGWFALHDRARVQAGETVLVHAGAGGAGSAAVQLAQAMGARVIATAGGPTKKAVLTDQLRVDVAIDYLNEDFVEVVKAATDGQGVDVIYDPVGGDTFDRSRKVIGWDGRILIIGFTGGRIADAPTNHVLLKNYSIVGVHWGASLARDPNASRNTYDKLIEFWNAGKIDPLVMREVPFADVPAAFDALASRESWGKLVIAMNSG